LRYKAYITLGNTKAVDIAVELTDGRMLKFDVKGKASFNAGTYMDLPKEKPDENHYFVFIGLQIKEEVENKIRIESEPECYIVKSENLEHFAADWKPSGAKDEDESRYGMNQKIFRILREHKNENEVTRKSDVKYLNRLKNKHNIKGNLNFDDLRSKFLTLSDFENKFHKLKGNN
jgi:hypothetical protein